MPGLMAADLARLSKFHHAQGCLENGGMIITLNIIILVNTHSIHEWRLCKQQWIMGIPVIVAQAAWAFEPPHFWEFQWLVVIEITDDPHTEELVTFLTTNDVV
jgi:hypothetical protein